MKKFIYLIIIIGIVLLGAIGYVALRGPRQLAIENSLPIPTKNGEVRVKDFYKEAAKVSETKPFPYVLIRSTKDYEMAYFPKDQGFIIALSRQPVQKARERAEKDFLEALGISKEEACKLSVSLTVTRDVDINLAGGNYYLSFCPNGIPF